MKMRNEQRRVAAESLPVGQTELGQHIVCPVCSTEIIVPTAVSGQTVFNPNGNCQRGHRTGEHKPSVRRAPCCVVGEVRGQYVEYRERTAVIITFPHYYGKGELGVRLFVKWICELIVLCYGSRHSTRWGLSRFEHLLPSLQTIFGKSREVFSPVSATRRTRKKSA